MGKGKGKMKKRWVSMAVVAFALLFGMIAPVQAIGVPFTIYGQVFDTDGTTPVDGVKVTVTNIETGSSVEHTVTASGGHYVENLGNLEPNSSHNVGDRIQIFVDDGKAGKTNTTVVSRAAFSPQQVDLILQASTPTPTLTPTPAQRRGGGGGGGGPSDTDGDGYSDIEELTTGTDPYDPCDPNPACTACVGERIVEELVSTPKPIAKPVATQKSAVKPTSKSIIPEPEEPEKKPVPGFEAGFAIAGLLAVAYLVLRRKKW
jgi:PGF-CTERM protein